MKRSMLFGMLALVLTTALFPSQALADHAGAAKDALVRAESFLSRAQEVAHQAKKSYEEREVRLAIVLRDKARGLLGVARDALWRAGREVEMMKKHGEDGAKDLAAAIERLWEHVHELSAQFEHIK